MPHARSQSRNACTPEVKLLKLRTGVAVATAGRHSGHQFFGADVDACGVGMHAGVESRVIARGFAFFASFLSGFAHGMGGLRLKWSPGAAAFLKAWSIS